MLFAVPSCVYDWNGGAQANKTHESTNVQYDPADRHFPRPSERGFSSESASPSSLKRSGVVALIHADFVGFVTCSDH